MTRKEMKCILPLMQAYAEGKTIQVLVDDDEWMDIYEPSFRRSPMEYRIKPEGESNKTTKLYESYE